jgi:NAD(P)H-flavin reductase
MMAITTHPTPPPRPTPDPMLPHPYRVRRVRREIPETFTLELESADTGSIPPYAAGQFNMLYVFGVGEIPISISGDPSKREPLVHTTRAVGTVSRAMHALKAGDMIGVRGPFGSQWPLERAAGKDVILVAGGIGLAPLRPAMYQILAERERYGKVALVYGARTPAELLYQRQLEQWRARFDLDVSVTVDRAVGSWQGSVGVVTRLIPRAAIDPATAVALVCGPEIMMRFSAAELLKRGLAAERIFVSMERNMKCAVGLCGHCQYGPKFVCKDGPVFAYSDIQALLGKREI